MEGVGSRLGRASSRYGPSSTTAVFNGPVRKWKRKWVHVSSSPTSTAHTTHNKTTTTTTTTTNSRLLLCKWTPLPPPPTPPPADVDEDLDLVGPTPTRRRFRYTPVVVIEEERKAAKKVEPNVNANVTKHLTSWQASKQDEMDQDEALKEDIQDQDTTSLDLGLSLKDNNSDPENNGQLKKASSGGFWVVS